MVEMQATSHGGYSGPGTFSFTIRGGLIERLKSVKQRQKRDVRFTSFFSASSLSIDLDQEHPGVVDGDEN